MDMKWKQPCNWYCNFYLIKSCVNSLKITPIYMPRMTNFKIMIKLFQNAVKESKNEQHIK